MAVRTIAGIRPCTASGSSRRDLRITGMLVLIACLVAATILSGCGGGASTAETTGQVPDTGSGQGSATLSWATPSTYVDGSPLALGGYKVYYGTEPGVFTSVDVGNVNTYAIAGLASGKTYYFVVTDYDVNGLESDFSVQVSKTI